MTCCRNLVIAAAVATLTILVLTEVLLEVAWGLGVIWVVVWLVTILLVVELVRLLRGPLLRTVLALLIADELFALCLGKVVYASASEAGKHLLGEAVIDLLAFALSQHGEVYTSNIDSVSYLWHADASQTRAWRRKKLRLQEPHGRTRQYPGPCSEPSGSRSGRRLYDMCQYESLY